jgi:Tfp pilus assembly ATPase PilU
MQDQETTYFPVQPWMKLMQSNMQLLMQYSMSPDVMSQAMSQWQELVQRSQGTATQLVKSGAFADLIQGMMNNYSQFMSESAQAGMSMLSQTTAAVANRAQQAGAEAVNGSVERHGRRARS